MTAVVEFRSTDADRRAKRERRRADVVARASALRAQQSAARPEWIVDLFAGGGGWSVGVEVALHRPPDLAINHAAAALAMHALNHPTTRHLQADVFEVDPHQACEGHPVEYLHGSPDCTDFSKAKSDKPIRTRKRRALAWVLFRWAGTVRPPVITLENVEEWRGWGPLCAKRDRCRCKKKTKAVKSSRRGACRVCGASGRVITVLRNPETGELLTDAKGRPRHRVAAPGEVVPLADQLLTRDPRKAGRTHRRFVRLFEWLGYKPEFRERRACNAGAPTIRKRLYMIARCDGAPAVWPEATHGDPESKAVQSGAMKPWRTAAECIDFSLPMCSVFADKAEARAWAKRHGQAVPQRPLASATLRRTARGSMRYVVNNPKPFIVTLNHSGGKPHAPRSLSEPVRTLSASRDAHALVAPVLVDVAHGEVSPDGAVKRWGEGARGTEHPLGSVTGSGNPALTAPLLIANNTNNQPHAADAPVPTVTGGGRNILVAPYLVPRYGEGEGQEPRVRAVDSPSPVIVPTGNGGTLAAVHLASYHAERREGEERGTPPDAPLTTADTANRHAVIAAYLTQQNAGYYDGDGRPVDAPAGTVAASGSFQSLSVAALLKLKGKSSDADPSEPVHTISTVAQHGVAAAALTKMKGTSSDADPQAPLDTVAAGGNHHGLAVVRLAEAGDAEWIAWLLETYPHAAQVYGFLQKYYGAEQGQYHGLDEPIHTIPTVDRYGLVLVTVVVEGVRMVIVDIAMRMLQPRELFNAQGFPRSYMIDVPFYDKERGRWRNLTKTEQVRMVGNSVPPSEARAIVAANLPHLSERKVAA